MPRAERPYPLLLSPNITKEYVPMDRPPAVALTVAVIGWLWTSPSPSPAQGFGGGEIDRALRPGPYEPYDGAGFSHRYNYDHGPVFYFNYDASRLAYLDYLDRLDRQEHFGHLWPSRRFGPDYQIGRIENEYRRNSFGRFRSGSRFFRW
jgi:hypothetical protein